MKKLDLQKGDIKTKLILHVEKIVFGLTVALVAAFVYLGTQRATIDTSPENVSKAARDAKDNIAKSTWENIKSDRDNPPTYQAAAVRASTPMPAQPYEMALSFRLRQKESVEKRSDPQILPLEDLEVSAGFAPLAMLGPRQSGNQRMGYGGEGMDYQPPSAESYDYSQSYGRGGLQNDPDAPPELTAEQRRKFSTPRGGQGTIVRGQPFVVVKGLIPLKKQFDQYELEFKDRAQHNEFRDYPNYVWFQIERAEQRPDGTWTDWKALDVSKAIETIRDRAGYTPEEVAPPWYLDRMLTFPLPPLLLRNPGDWGLHSQVPKYEPPRSQQGGIMGRGMTMPGMMDLDELPEDEEEDAEPDDNARRPGVAGPPGVPAIPGLSGRGPGGMRDGRGMYESTPSYGAGEYGRTGGRIAPPPGTILRPTGSGTGTGTGRGSSESPSYGREGSGMSSASSPFDAERKLFRYVDTTVAENRTYRYRVQLWLEDPNYPLDAQAAPTPQALEPDVLARVSAVRKEEDAYNKANPRAPQPRRQYWRLAEFSEPSEGVTTPGRSTVLAGQVEAGRRTAAADSRIMTLRDPVATVLAMTWDDDKDVKAMVTQELKGIARGSVLRNTADTWILDPGTLKFEKQEKYNLKTNYVLLDMRGGELLPGRLTDGNKDRLRTPGEVLVMDVSTGKMAVQSEFADIDDFHLFNFTKEEVKTTKKDEEDPYGYSDYESYDSGSGRRQTRGSRRGGGP